MRLLQLFPLDIMLYTIAGIILVLIAHNTKRYQKPIAIILIIAYVLIMLKMTLFPIYLHNERLPLREVIAYKRPWNLMPLSLIIPQYKNMLAGQDGAARQFLGNIVLFIPVGLLLPLLSARLRKWYRVLFIGFLWTLFIETSQLVLHLLCMGWRSFDVDDLILNTFGALLGYFIYKIFFSRAHR